jgi:hypothetical protein
MGMLASTQGCVLTLSPGRDLIGGTRRILSLDRRSLFGAAVATVAAGPLGFFGLPERTAAMTEVAEQTGSDTTAIRPFPQLNVPETELVELPRRIIPRRPIDERTVEFIVPAH